MAEWVSLLAPLLTGEATLVYQALDEEDALNYKWVQQEILTRCCWSPLNALSNFHHWRCSLELNLGYLFEELLRNHTPLAPARYSNPTGDGGVGGDGLVQAEE